MVRELIWHALVWQCLEEKHTPPETREFFLSFMGTRKEHVVRYDTTMNLMKRTAVDFEELRALMVLLTQLHGILHWPLSNSAAFVQSIADIKTVRTGRYFNFWLRLLDAGIAKHVTYWQRFPFGQLYVLRPYLAHLTKREHFTIIESKDYGIILQKALGEEAWPYDNLPEAADQTVQLQKAVEMMKNAIEEALKLLWP